MGLEKGGRNSVRKGQSRAGVKTIGPYLRWDGKTATRVDLGSSKITVLDENFIRQFLVFRGFEKEVTVGDLSAVRNRRS